MSRPWPTEAAACWVARSRGRLVRPSGAKPAAIAPEETRTTSRPDVRAAAITSASPSTAAESISPAASVSDDDPTLTTIRRASTTAVRAMASAALEAKVRAAGTHHAGPRVDAGLPVEDPAVIASDDDPHAGLGAQRNEFVLDAQLGEPVGEEADGLVVGEVGLPDPAFGLDPADAIAVTLTADGELLLVDGARADDDALGLTGGRERPRCLDEAGHREGQLTQTGPRGRGDDEDVQPALAQDRCLHLGELGRLGEVRLVEGDE